jgi:pimeloyl-ACP methyl ester carboxylesterase
MKAFKIILKITGAAILLFLLACIIYIAASGPTLPAHTNEIIENVLSNPLPEIIEGETGFAESQGIKIWYESISPKDSSRGAILLIMGISNDALGWPKKFIRTFVNSGYQVIRYDHRGTGMSDWMENMDADNPYSLSDMADDVIEILNSLGIEKANIIGVSMGGMIAQETAINHPDRVASLTSIMSSGFIEDPELPAISSDIAWELIKVSLKYRIAGGEKNMIKLHLASRIVLRGDANYDLNIQEISEQVLYNIRKRKGYNSDVSRQHHTAVSISGSRYDKLKNISMPVLIIHGKSDPFIPIEHSKKCASFIPNADTLWLDGMGHDIPESLMDTISARIIANFKKDADCYGITLLR